MLMLTLASSFNNSNTNMESPPRRCYQTARSETSPPTGIPGSPLLLFSTTAGLDSSQIGRDFALKMVILTQTNVRSSSCCWIFRLLMKSTSCWVWSHQGFLFKQLLVSGAGTTFTYLPVMLFLILPKHINHRTNIKKTWIEKFLLARPGKHQTSDGHCREGVQNTTGGQIYKNIAIIVIIIISIIAFSIHFQRCILNVPRFLSLNILPPHIWTSSAGWPTSPTSWRCWRHHSL